MMTGRVAFRVTSNDFYDLVEREMMRYEIRPGASASPESWTSHTRWPEGGSTILVGQCRGNEV